MVRTSISHPLPIREVACSEGAIGMTYCPGKIGPSVFGEPWRRDQDIDLNTLAQWGARAVVTLMDDGELADLGASSLGAAVEALGLEWHHLPIPDEDIPGASFERRWIYSGHRVRALLRSGKKVAIHCRGGRGRTALVTSRVLIECGASPKAARELVWRANPEASATQAQGAYIDRLRGVSHDETHMARLLGCLFGGAVGDGFGFTVEFHQLAQIRERFGRAGLLEPELRGGRLVVSDDTQMTLFTGAGLIEAFQRSAAELGLVAPAIREAYLQWYMTQRRDPPKPLPIDGLLQYAELWKQCAPGNTCISALSRGGGGTLSAPINDSKGCGGVMRTAPIGLLRTLTIDEAFALGAEAAAITHGHPCGYLSAGLMSAAVRGLIEGLSLEEAVARARLVLAGYPHHEETLAAVEGVSRALAIENGDDAIRSLGAGWVGEEAIAIGLYAVLRDTKFEETVAVAANHSGDSDSTASIAGQIWGAKEGVSSIPHSWVRHLDVFDALCDVAAGLAQLDSPPVERGS